MKAIQRILLGMEFSDAAQSALYEANVLARTFGAEVVLAHAIAGPEPAVVRDHASKLLERIATDLEADDVRVQRPLLLREGQPADVVLAAARDVGADLIVLGAGEKTVADRWLLGSSAERVARESLSPVWLTRPGKDHRRVKKIVCAVDGSDLAAEALATAAFLARTFTARLDILTVTQPTPGGTASGPPSYTLDVSTGASSVPRGGVLDRALAAIDLHGIEHRVLMRAGKPATRIVECADEVGADLLVIGSAGRRGLARLVRGNTAEKVIRSISCSTLVVPRQEPLPS